jgi:hypothetical protein
MTKLEKKLWGMLYRSQMALAIMCLDESGRTAGEGEWPKGHGWKDIGGSSKAIFARMAREKAGIDHDEYLRLLREDYDAMLIAEDIFESMEQNLEIQKKSLEMQKKRLFGG